MNLQISTLGTVTVKAGKSVSFQLITSQIQQENYMSIMPYCNTVENYDLSIMETGRVFIPSDASYRGTCTVKNNGTKDAPVMVKLLFDAPKGVAQNDDARLEIL